MLRYAINAAAIFVIAGAGASAQTFGAGGRAQPALAADGIAPVREGNTAWSAARGVYDVLIEFPRPARTQPVVGGGDPGRAGRILNQLHAQGRAAGHHGDLYDNRDSGHSSLSRERFPTLTVTRYAEDTRAARLHYGLNLNVDFGATVIGNSSTAVTSGPLARSLPRLALTAPGGPSALFRQYARNHVYIYPAHRDHGAGTGDLLPANTPYMLISQGSSGSDRPLLEAAAMTLAAFQPRTKAALRENGLIAPTLQMILRLARVDGDVRRYLSPEAHPSVFSGATPLERLVRLANALAPDQIPPMPQLAAIELTEEDQPPSGPVMSETLFDTPSAIARVAHGLTHTRRWRLSAAGTRDPNGRPLQFRWVLLRGAPEAVRLSPAQGGGAEAIVEVDWGAGDGSAPRAEIAVFAHNGAVWSAPAIFSVLTPVHERREWDAGGRILFVDHATAPPSDPLVFPARRWSDAFERTPDGALLGWRRQRADGSIDRFTRHGARVIDEDELDRPLRAVGIGYDLVRPSPGAPATVVERETSEVLIYEYDGAGDRLGRATQE
jgi:hypothetical protein